MSQALNAACARGWNLAMTLMDYLVVFRAGDPDFGVMLAAEYDGEHEFGPHPW